MANLFYNFSPKFQQTLKKAEALRHQILLTPLAPKQEIKLRWEAGLNRIYYTLQLTGNPSSKIAITKLLTNPPRHRLKITQQEAINYKKAFDYISQNWLVSNRNVAFSTILTLHKIYPRPHFHPIQIHKALKQLLTYLQTTQPENPFVQAGIAFIRFPHFDQNQHLAHLFAYLLLYKQGFDCRGLLVLEEYFAADLLTFQRVASSAQKTNNLTFWLEYFAQAVASQLETTASKLLSPISFQYPSASFWKLNERQKVILTFLDQPNTIITNRQVQKMFKVSQITASRDLTKLKNLNLVFSHGRGRSTTYSKV